MKQKIVVRAVIKNRRGRTLFLRRIGGRPSISGKYELPGGKLLANEQPVDAVRRTVLYHTGMVAKTVQLLDVVSFIDPDDRELQYIFVLYLVSSSANTDMVVLDNGYDKYTWKKKSEIQRNVVTKSTEVLLDIENDRDYRKKNIGAKKKYVIYTDGGSRGNPGPSAAGFVIMDSDENVLVEDGRFLGRATSDMAEYAGIFIALTRAKDMGIRSIELRSDSLSAVNQLNGIYVINNKMLLPLFVQISNLRREFDKVVFLHVNRDFNRMADGVVNKILDEHERK
ncbi:MAG: reverse transcriptase-like protein [Candidatus Nomurabacteria bacterium]|jgi:ribonuclease HI/ADP-ribose pyrophosphatase YjhB (NUDIX family)|nr:reverse transcriptase-like protein [Candidatus Nomurabacteria bacterium]